jgi:radical SAM superfamily enzyme YgiQ (UPF0313 family)
MARTLLISANPLNIPFPVYPIGLGYIAQACSDAGHDAVQADIQLEEPDRLLARIGESGADIVGLSIRNIDNCDSANFCSSRDYYGHLVGKIRTVTDRPIVLGGSGFSLYAEALMRQTGADYGIVGEGEQKFVSLLNACDEHRMPPRGQLIAAPDSGPVKKFRSPLRDRRMVDYYLQFGGMINVQTKRGCPYECAYCAYPLLEGAFFRSRDENDVLEECREVLSRSGASYIYFTDSVFNDPQDFYLKIAEQFVKREIKTPWTAFFRPRTGWRKDDVRLLHRSGLDCVEWGSDCTTDATLSKMGKGFDWSAVEESNAVFAEEGIANGHYFVFGGPGETRATIAEGLKNIGRLNSSVVFAFIGIRIIPRTRIHKLAIADGIVAPDWDGLKEMFFLSPDVTWTEVDAAIRASFAGDVCRMYPQTGNEKIIAALHQRGLKGPLWDFKLKSRRRVRS